MNNDKLNGVVVLNVDLNALKYTILNLKTYEGAFYLRINMIV